MHNLERNLHPESRPALCVFAESHVAANINLNN